MHRTILLFSMLFATLAIINCKSSEVLPNKYNGKQIIFGRGGGFTGVWELYFILDNGNVYKRKSDVKNYEFMKKLDKKTVKSVFAKLEEVDFVNTKFSKPGNMSYSIEYISDETMHKVTWGDYQSPPPKNIKAFYKFLKDLIK